MKKIILVFVTVMFFGLGVKAQDDISGLWKRPDGLMLKISKSGDNWTVTNNNNGYDHTGTLKFKGSDIYKGTLERKNKSTGCTTYISMKFELLDDEHMKYNGTGLDTNCDLPANFTESFTYTKVDE